MIYLFFLMYPILIFGEILSPGWQQYFPSTQSWSHSVSTGGYSTDALINLRPPRHRIGQGRYRLIPPASAELNCDFPESMLMISNVVWERADIGSRDLHQIYKRAGVPHQYDVHIRPRGSTLHIFDVTPLDRGIYRCIATGLDPSTNSVVTLFQDTEFFPEQTIPLNKIVNRDFIIPASIGSTTERYYRPYTSSYYTNGYSTVPYSVSTLPSTIGSYTVNSDFIYSSGNKDQDMVGAGTGNGNTNNDDGTKHIYVYDKNSYLHNFITDRNDNSAVNAGSDENENGNIGVGQDGNADYKTT